MSASANERAWNKNFGFLRSKTFEKTGVNWDSSEISRNILNNVIRQYSKHRNRMFTVSDHFETCYQYFDFRSQTRQETKIDF